jgi:TetR/AcrR family transcriptional regulator, transcriptional repressor for nem operon
MLAEAIGLGKSGIMHHHDSKEGLLRAVIGYAKSQMRDYVLSVAQEDLPDEQRLEKLLRRQNRLAKHEQRGCFFANLALETGRDGIFNDDLTHFFEEWQQVLASIWATRMTQEQAAEQAYLLLLEYEGAVIIYKLSGDEQHLERLVVRTVNHFKQYPPIITTASISSIS